MPLARRPNRLIHARSPYLRQHAYNPVDWYPWGPEALERARREDKPIFLSIGYSACHWCHVMERESFEDEELARLLNEHFVPVKVDREERPDLDMIYQRAAQLAGVPGGWPLSVFLTPDLKPFWVGTYLPPEDRWGRPGFGRVLRTLATMWRERRAELERVAERLAAAVAQVDAPPEPAAPVPVPGPGEEDRQLLRAAAARLLRHVDWRHGGFGGAPKFPNPTALQLLLRVARRARPGDELGSACRLALLLTLRRMADGGIYDQLGGGFHRYAVDEAWHVPHFEKMLYDNAQLIPLFLEASLLAEDPCLAGRFRRVAEETIAYVARELAAPEGGFYSAQDADSEGEEGRYFTWTPAELEAALGAEDARLAAEHYGVTEAGALEGGRSVLRVAVPPEELAARHGLPAQNVAERLEAIRRRLREARARRVPPAVDDKVLAGWNGLMITGLARAALLTGEEGPLALARRAADFLLARLCRPDGHLYRAAKDGEPYQDGFLEDYGFAVAGLLELYQASFDRRYLEAALRLTDAALERFWDERQGGFFFTPRDGEPLPVRPRDATDSAVPSPTALMALNLLLLEPFRGDGQYLRRAEAVLRAYRPLMVEHPLAASTLVLAHDTYVHGPVEVALAGPDDATLRDWARAAARLLVPGCLLTRVPAEAAADPHAPPIWAGRAPRDGRPTAYVCRDRTCSPPLTDREALTRELARALG